MKENEILKKIIIATGNYELNEIISNFEEFEVMCNVDYKEHLYDSCEKYEPDILIVTDLLGGKIPLINSLLEIKSKFTNIRVVYFCGSIDYSDIVRVNALNSLISIGIYDIVPETSLNDDLILFRLKTPMTKEQNHLIISKLTSSIYGNRKNTKINFIQRKNLDEVNSNIYPNLFTFISSKKGVGNTLLISNLAVSIANMGLNNPNGSKPQIALIDLDFEGFNLSNNFDTLDNKKNIFNAIYETKRIITADGLVDNRGLQLEVIDNVKKMFIPTKKYSNIKILGGPNSKYSKDDITYMNHDNLVFILETIADEYDIILVDSKSDSEFNQVFPLFSMSKNVYSVLEMSFNSFSNNNRLSEYYYELLDEKKVKYILNKEIENDNIPLSSEDLNNYLNYNFIAKIPYINPKTIYLLDYKKDFIINQNDKDLLNVRFQILKASNDIWPIKNFNKLEHKLMELSNLDKEIKTKNKTYLDIILNKIGINYNEEKSIDNIKEVINENNFINKVKSIKYKELFKNLINGINELINTKKKKGD